MNAIRPLSDIRREHAAALRQARRAALPESKREQATVAKRQALANRVKDLAERSGAAVTLKNEDSRGIGVCVTLRDYRASLSIEPGICGAFIVDWYTAVKATCTYPSWFGMLCNGTVNTYHWQKATTVAYTVGALLRGLEAGLAELCDPVTIEECDPSHAPAVMTKETC